MKIYWMKIFNSGNRLIEMGKCFKLETMVYVLKNGPQLSTNVLTNVRCCIGLRYYRL